MHAALLVGKPLVLDDRAKPVSVTSIAYAFHKKFVHRIAQTKSIRLATVEHGGVGNFEPRP
jgi:hypothetical protein